MCRVETDWTVRPGNIAMGAVIKASQLKPGQLKRLLQGRGEDIALPRTHSRTRVTTWYDIPSSWGTCRKDGMAFYPKEAGCVICGGCDEP